MNTIQPSINWIPTIKIAQFLTEDILILFWILFGLCWLFYRVFLKNTTQSRHETLKKRLSNLLIYLILCTWFSAVFWGRPYLGNFQSSWPKLFAYMGLVALILESLIIVQIGQLSLYLYLFFSNMKKGVPRLIVNLFTLVFAIVVFIFVASQIFGLKVAPVLATSAVFSIVLGLAMQDTLGNLFSGLSLQFESPFAIGDWIEVYHSDRFWTGQIQEITWRSTILLGFSDELIVIPNKIISSSQVQTFSKYQYPTRRWFDLRLDHASDTTEAKRLILEAIRENPFILKNPEPRVLILEVTDSWLLIRALYSFNDYGIQYRIADQIIESMLKKFNEANIRLAHKKLDIVSKS